MQFLTENKMSVKKILCYLGGYFQRNECSTNASNLVIYVQEQPTLLGVSAPFDLNEFIETTKSLAHQYQVQFTHPEHSNENPKQMQLSKKVSFVYLAASSVPPTNAIVVSPSSLTKRQIIDKQQDNEDKFEDISTSFTLFLFISLLLMVFVVLGVQLLASAAPVMGPMVTGGRMKSD